MADSKLIIKLDQFRVGQHHVVGFEDFRGFIDMLRFAGQISVDYNGGDEFTLNVNPRAASSIVGRFASFGIKAEEEAKDSFIKWDMTGPKRPSNKKGQPTDNRKRCRHGEINCVECMSKIILDGGATSEAGGPA